MKSVPTHEFKSNFTVDELDSMIDFIDNVLPYRLAKAPARQGRFVFAHIGRACWAYFVGDGVLARRFANVAFDCAVAVFAAAYEAGTVTFELEEKQLTGPGGAPDHSANEGVWIEGFLLGLALGRSADLQVLVGYPTPLLGAGPGTGDAFRAPMVNALKAFVTDDHVWHEYRDRALALSEPERLSVMGPRQAEPYRAVLRALEPIAASDQASFTEALLSLVRAHKAHFGRGRASRGCDSLLSVPACGIAALGLSRGLKLEVDSGYLPNWLVSPSPPLILESPSGEEIDPTLKIETGDGTSADHLSARRIRYEIGRLDARTANRFAILIKERGHFAQCYSNGEDSFDLEYQEGGPDHHYTAASPASRSEVVDLFVRYASGGDFCQGRSWSRLEL